MFQREAIPPVFESEWKPIKEFKGIHISQVIGVLFIITFSSSSFYEKVLVDLNMVTIHAGTVNGDVDFGIKT